MPQAKDTAVFLRDFGKTATTATQAAKVLLDFPEDVETFGTQSQPGQVAGHPRIQYATADLTLVNGTEVTIEGTKYKVRWTRKLDDGVFSVAELKRG